MTESQARTHLRRMLGTLTAGSVLHLLGELFAERAAAARRDGDALTTERGGQAAATLFEVGLGIPADCPR